MPVPRWSLHDELLLRDLRETHQDQTWEDLTTTFNSMESSVPRSKRAITCKWTSIQEQDSKARKNDEASALETKAKRQQPAQAQDHKTKVTKQNTAVGKLGKDKSSNQQTRRDDSDADDLYGGRTLEETLTTFADCDRLGMLKEIEEMAALEENRALLAEKDAL